MKIASGAEIVGVIQNVKNVVYGTLHDNPRSPKNERDAVFHDELLETVDEGALIVQLMDNTELTMGSNSSLIIDEMVYDPQSNNGKAVVNFLSGVFFYTSGLLPKKNILLITPTASIGIRGTDIQINISTNGATSVGVVSGQITVTSRLTQNTRAVEAGNSISVDSDGSLSSVSEGISKTDDPNVDDAAEDAANTNSQKV